MHYVGNDIIDLKDDESVNKHLDVRFMNRVFTHSERQRIRQSPDPNRTLWILWASKEAAYKIFSKMMPEVKFLPKLFQIQNFNPKNKIFFGTKVFYKGKTAKLKVRSMQDYICVSGAWIDAKETGHQVYDFKAKVPDDFVWLRKHFKKREWKSISSMPSAWVRFSAKRWLAKKLKISFDQIAIVRHLQDLRWGFPKVYWKMVRAKVDISLSHHGRWMAWTISIPLLNSHSIPF